MIITKSTKTVTVRYKSLTRDYVNVTVGAAISMFLAEYKSQS